MSKVKNENYIVIQGFMINELNLKGNELLIYAIIYGFSQTENQRFTGGLQYLADWTNSSKQGVTKNLKSLVEKGYIIKEDKVINGVKFCEYYTTKFNGGIQQSLMGGIKQSLINNIDNNNINNNINKKEIKKKKESFNDFFEKNKMSIELENALKDFIDMRKTIKKPMTTRALELLVKQLNKLSNDEQTQIAILNQSIVHRLAVSI